MWPNGTNAKLIMKDASSPAWSDDGTRIFVQRDTCTAPGGCDSSDEDTIAVYSVALDGTDAHPVSDGDYNVDQAGWPPGQNVLSFLGDESTTSRGAQAGPTEVNSLDATWSPDGTELAVADAPTGLWVIDDEGRPQLLAKGAFSSLSWGSSGHAAGSTIRSALIAPALPSEAAAVTVAASVHTAMRSPRFASPSWTTLPASPRSMLA